MVSGINAPAIALPASAAEWEAVLQAKTLELMKIEEENAAQVVFAGDDTGDKAHAFSMREGKVTLNYRPLLNDLSEEQKEALTLIDEDQNGYIHAGPKPGHQEQ